MSEEKKDAPPEVREKIVKALKEGRVKWSDHGQEYWDRAGVISNKPDFTVVKVDPKFWGPWKKEKDGHTFGNQGGVEISWQTVSAGFGGLTIYRDFDGKIKADTEGMGPKFCNEVLDKLDDDAKKRIVDFFGMEHTKLVESWQSAN